MKNLLVNTSASGSGHAVALGADGALRPVDKYDGPLLMADKGQCWFRMIIRHGTR